ncbi:MAG: hypothetical protein LUD15_04740 [Bacteroides sp.]|nr:hypothetical protein [Bacteroides sp.]
MEFTDEDLLRTLGKNPFYDKRLPQYIGKTMQEIREAFSRHEVMRVNTKKVFPLDILVTTPEGTLMFIFQENEVCSDALFFSNSEGSDI